MTEREAQILQEAAQIIAKAKAEADGYTIEGNQAPTLTGKAYHSWRARRDAEAEAVWNDLGNMSPFGGGFCRLMGGIAGALKNHHRRGGFFAGLFD